MITKNPGAPVEHYRGYTIWHWHPHSTWEWCASGSDGTIWFEDTDYPGLCAAINRALDEA